MIFLTGATGFLGKAVMQRLLLHHSAPKVSVGVRASGLLWPSGVSPHVTGDLTAATDFSAALQGVSAVVHCAARVHVMADKAASPMNAFRQANVHGTLNLARQAAVAGVKRFVFISSIKVNGEATLPWQPFTADDSPMPLDPYGVSKMEAEQGLREIALQTGMEVVIIRPPLVYGPGVKANFQAMMRWLARGIPLPLGAIDNRRSLVALGNLVDLIVT